MAYNKEPDSDGEKKNKSIKNKSNLESTKLPKNCHYFFLKTPSPLGSWLVWSFWLSELSLGLAAAATTAAAEKGALEIQVDN